MQTRVGDLSWYCFVLSGLAVSHDSAFLASMSTDASVKIFDIKTLDMMAMLKLPFIPSCIEWVFKVWLCWSAFFSEISGMKRWLQIFLYSWVRIFFPVTFLCWHRKITSTHCFYILKSFTYSCKAHLSHIIASVSETLCWDLANVSLKYNFNWFDAKGYEMCQLID